jgi:16S rRNA (uracil1498-N3)-methyltransferase
MSDRYFLATPPADGTATLDAAEAHHLLHVMRAKVGTAVTLFDGHGGEYDATIAKCGRSEVLLSVAERRDVNRELPVRITLGVALPKGDRQKWLVEKLTELGAAKLVPLSTERSVADLKGKSLEKLERSVIEASKQCGRNTLMEITEPVALGEFLSTSSDLRLLAHPSGEPLANLKLGTAKEVAILIGPEGGFSDAEVDAARAAGWQCVGLGASILRIETAALAMVAVVGCGIGGAR